MRLIPLLVISLLFLSACGTPRRGENVAGPLTLASEKEVRGERYFMTYCNKCHPLGESGVGHALNNKPLPGPLIRTRSAWERERCLLFPRSFFPTRNLTTS
ncbi:cytochrome c [Geotalea toluenoxydans]|uniref:cytochrome c n=1 Tax=Geotalea toluenoxydans TaxID=421624 RepID=UPI000A8E03EA|nr:cytochrome c [Geotalea toluenoxydans]